MNKKDIREAFRNACYERDGHRCAMCGFKPDSAKWGDYYACASSSAPLDAHHVTDRNYMPGGGYVKENGISLCGQCHLRAEVYHSTGVPYPGYSPLDLYARIGSNYGAAVSASLMLSAFGIADIGDWWQEYSVVIAKEIEISKAVNAPLGSTTWELACEELKITDRDMLNYGKGRYL